MLHINTIQTLPIILQLLINTNVTYKPYYLKLPILQLQFQTYKLIGTEQTYYSKVIIVIITTKARGL